jgi:hypothetical protein
MPRIKSHRKVGEATLFIGRIYRRIQTLHKEGSPQTDKLIAASVQWAGRIMEKIDSVFSSSAKT